MHLPQVSYGDRTQDCYLKSNPHACSAAAPGGHLCPWAIAGYEYHIRCPCGPAEVGGCPAAWGSYFLGLTVLLVVGYVGGGSAYNHRNGRRGAAVLPHSEQWAVLGAHCGQPRIRPLARRNVSSSVLANFTTTLLLLSTAV